MPTSFDAVIGSAFDGSTSGISVFVVNQDPGPRRARVEEILDQIDALRNTRLCTPEQADQRVADWEALAAIIIPATFCQQIDAFYEGSENSPATLLGDMLGRGVPVASLQGLKRQAASGRSLE